MPRIKKAFFKAPVFIVLLLVLPLLAEVTSLAMEKAGWTQHDLAYYLDESTINFVRPGLVVKITNASISNNQLSVRFTVKDPRGLPLDREGITTPGAVSTSFIAAFIPQNQKLYTAYTTRSQTSPITGRTAIQAGADSGGTYAKVADGEYTYTFRTAIPANFDRTATHSVGVYSSRNLSEFELPTNYDDDVFNFVPSGAAVTRVRDVVKTETCNKCHDQMAFHGGSRRSVELCILCHTTQTDDPDTGNTVDMTVMVHKIHMGENLPSVEAGRPYQIIGNRQSVHDYSHVAFPDLLNRCDTCHTGATQSNIYLTEPSRRACGSCHDDINFATGEGHVDQPQVSDNMCSTCHIPQGELEFDASIRGAHTIPQYSTQLPGTTFQIVRVQNAAPGQRPTVTFRLTDRQGNVIDASTMNSMSLVMAGPTSDINGYISESARGARRVGNDYEYTFTNPVPAGAVGSYIFSLEGYKEVRLNEGTRKEMTVRDVGRIQSTTVSLSGGAPAQRRIVVDEAKCNACHGQLMLHGTIRRDVQNCNTCHNPNLTDAARRPATAGLPQGLHFKYMIHLIHTGENAGRTDLQMYGRSMFDASNVRYPGDRRNCEACHVNGTQNVPIGEGLLPTQAPRAYVPTMQPITAACLSCHTSQGAAAHASVMTSPSLGESCSACHGDGREVSVARAHAR